MTGPDMARSGVFKDVPQVCGKNVGNVFICNREFDHPGFCSYTTPSMDLTPHRALPADSAERKKTPITTGVLDYFPEAIAEIARVSFIGNEQHNPGEPLHWAREKSTDHADCIARHLMERGTVDTDGTRHTAKLAWRALALLQSELEANRK